MSRVPPQITPMNTGQALRRAKGNKCPTPECILDAEPDVREAYRALNNLRNDALYVEQAFITARALACILNWRYARAEAAIFRLHEKKWVGCRERDGVTKWIATP